jgi:hypothetical protein
MSEKRKKNLINDSLVQSLERSQKQFSCVFLLVLLFVFVLPLTGLTRGATFGGFALGCTEDAEVAVGLKI